MRDHAKQPRSHGRGKGGGTVKRPVVFLDFDGVIHDMNAGKFFPAAVEALNWLLSETGAAVVVSSNWRMGYERGQLEDALASAGVSPSEVLDVTPVSQLEVGGMFNAAPRWKEIAEWLRMNGNQPHLVLDDDAGARPDVQTHFRQGLTMEQAQAGARILRQRVNDRL